MSEPGMIDLVAAIALTALAVISTGALILAGPLDHGRAARLFANVQAVGVAVVVPVLIVAVHVGRLLGGFFLVLYAEGRLPATFALSAGWGDITIALVPGFLVPTYLLAHLAVFARIAARERTSALSDLTVSPGHP
jgi:hypothetical protein